MLLNSMMSLQNLPLSIFFSSLFKSSSAICMLQIQDIFALDNNVCEDDIHFERINIPGTVQDINWSYRITLTLEDLIKNESLSSKLGNLISERKSQKISL